MEKLNSYNQYLTEERGIDPRIYNHYADQLRIDQRGNIVVPMYQHGKQIKFAFSGYNTKLTQYYAPGGEQIKDLSYGQKSISVLKPEGKDYKNVIISESAIDGMSYLQIRGLEPKETMIVSTNGQTSEKARQLAAELAEGKNAIIAVDNDKAGKHFIDQLKQQKSLENALVDVPAKNKDWNEELKQRIHDEQHRAVQEQERTKTNNIGLKL